VLEAPAAILDALANNIHRTECILKRWVGIARRNVQERSGVTLGKQALANATKCVHHARKASKSTKCNLASATSKSILHKTGVQEYM
jgi:hypothetical protein